MKIAKEARECVQECVSEFVSFITSEASDRCHQEKRKTINGEDILFAMAALGFDNYVEPLKIYLQKYRDANKGDKPEESFSSGMVNIAAAGTSSGITASTLVLKTETGVDGEATYTVVGTPSEADFQHTDIDSKTILVTSAPTDTASSQSQSSTPSNVVFTYSTTDSQDTAPL